MRVWFLSDLCLEMSPQWHLPSPRPRCDVVVVAADLITRAERGVQWLLDMCPTSQRLTFSEIARHTVRTSIVL